MPDVVYQVADLDAVGQVDRGRREPGSGAGGTFITETKIEILKQL